jgi:hypothetical protein
MRSARTVLVRGRWMIISFFHGDVGVQNALGSEWLVLFGGCFFLEGRLYRLCLVHAVSC